MQENHDFSFLKAGAVKKIIHDNTDDIYSAIERAYLAHHTGKAINPCSQFLFFPDKPSSRIISLPAALCDNEPVAGVKWIASNPDNIKVNMPRASAIIVLNDYKTGLPFVCMEAATISATRTAYSAVLASEYINDHNKKIPALSIIGNGPIAASVYQALIARGHSIDSIFLYDLNSRRSQQFSEETIDKDQHTHVSVCNDLKTAITQANMVVLTTTVKEPYIDQLSWFSHNPIVLNISLRDLSPHILLNANNIVDDIEHVLNANTSPHLAYLKSGNTDFITGSIADLINGHVSINQDQPTIFSPMGMGILDLALARLIYKISDDENLLMHIDNFLFD